VTAGVFVTGTDTGVGKTLVTCAVIHALTARGVKVLPMKPIAAGAVIHDGGWANPDSIALLRAADGHPARMRDVTPVLLRQPMAPHIAAARENRRIMLEPILASYRKLAADAEFMVVEGVGGFRVPLDVDFDTVHLARAIGLPVLLVVGLRLGCLNHALLSADAVKASGLPLAGWIANAIDPDMAAPMENIAALEDRLEAPLLGRIPFASPPDARQLAAEIDVAALLGKSRA
jgi:dethiobiotin synthetase